MQCEKCYRDTRDVGHWRLRGSQCVLCAACLTLACKHLDAAAKAWLAAKPEGGGAFEALLDAHELCEGYRRTIARLREGLEKHRHTEHCRLCALYLYTDKPKGCIKKCADSHARYLAGPDDYESMDKAFNEHLDPKPDDLARPIDVAVALEMYKHKVGHCDTLRIVAGDMCRGTTAGRLPVDVINYVQLAMSRFGAEAAKRNRENGI